MKNFREYSRVIAVKEMSAGNDTIGDMWIETKSFSKDDSINEIIKWANDCSGRLIITVDESDALNGDF